MYQTGSVNGLICLYLYSPNLKSDRAYICNPVTREYVILPSKYHGREGLLEVIYGLGVSSLTGEYKVVSAFQVEILPNSNKPSQPSVLEAEVYTLGTGQWRSLVPIPITYRLNRFQEFCGPFLNNHCHWIVSDNEILKENQFHGQSLAILKRCLCKLDTYHSELTIWVMKEYGINNSWHKEVVSSLVRTFPRRKVLPNGDRPSRPSVLEAEVYTLGTGHWRSIGSVPYWLNGSESPFLNNHCHWILPDKEDAPKKLSTFDFDKEAFQLFPSPPSESEFDRPQRLPM
ncbi:hypothetical protein OSB04_015695 [Centaurea solstitialis]|uniref:F-box associated domain-containing protein n=1 Tax=Centaurea solstitialis TaxID=347529 RepID=A0AA38TBH8_9ASTR|nr:hypothetical protein OSB04_015695 [Centaurea solstitialis]